MRTIAYYVIALIVIIADQWSKRLVVQQMEIGERIEVNPGYVSILSHRNSGAAWGMLEGKMAFFYVVTIFVVGGLLYYFYKEAKHDTLLSVAIMLLVGGAIGNFIDRVLYQHVVDFISVWIPVIDYNFPIFNIADAALTIGVILLIIHMVFEEKLKSKVKS